MQSSIFALVAFGLLLTLVQCKFRSHFKEDKSKQGKSRGTVYQIKQDFLGEGRSYTITSQTKSASNFSIRNESSSSVGEKLTLLKNGKERYTVKHDILKSMSTWTISNSTSGRELGKIENKVGIVPSEVVAEGEFGHYVLKDIFNEHGFIIFKNNHKRVAMTRKRQFNSHEPYHLFVYAGADEPLMVLFVIIVDEILEH